MRRFARTSFAVPILLALLASHAGASGVGNLGNRLSDDAITASPSRTDAGASIGTALGGAARSAGFDGTFARQAGDFWKTAVSDWGGFADKLRAGQQKMATWGERIQSVQLKTWRGERLSFLDKQVKKRYDAGVNEILTEGRGLVRKTGGGLFDLWGAIPPVVKSIFSFF